ncbi:uncharacterized protein LOC142349803 isoform X2 [Convolutriloba macropyga]|uniref:uncharacterized protein LOC142349803 isoform X2 n=1 Tax=Convolutriloba macropyga TaxID=536237 RepID=UPI003F523CA8
MTTVESEDFKSYEPLFPCQNKKIQESLDKSTFKKHRKAVDSASTVLDTKQPRVYIHQHLKLKKLQIEEERLATIERDNRLLLERIAKIMRTTGSIDNNNMDREMKSINYPNQLRVYSSNTPRIFLARRIQPDLSDEHLDDLKHQLSRPCSAYGYGVKISSCTPTTVYKHFGWKLPLNHSNAMSQKCSHSLSIERRQRELLRITQENKRILSQIMARKTKSDYSRTNWEPKWKKEEYYMAQLSRFQPVTRKTKKTEGEDDGDEQGEGRAKKESNGQELEQQKAD